MWPMYYLYNCVVLNYNCCRLKCKRPRQWYLLNGHKFVNFTNDIIDLSLQLLDLDTHLVIFTFGDSGDNSSQTTSTPWSPCSQWVLSHFPAEFVSPLEDSEKHKCPKAEESAKSELSGRLRSSGWVWMLHGEVGQPLSHCQ